MDGSVTGGSLRKAQARLDETAGSSATDRAGD
jgi:hypothetical protein